LSRALLAEEKADQEVSQEFREQIAMTRGELTDAAEKLALLVSRLREEVIMSPYV
jgi:hypothetical protein